MQNDLNLNQVRNVLIRLEETIIFALIERAQFCANPAIYTIGAVGAALSDASILDFLLHESERSHAKMRRYTSPDEHPFFADLPDPILPPQTTDSSLMANQVNINESIKQTYLGQIVPLICASGDDGNYGSSAVCDVSALQTLSRRIHYGKFVAESKYQQAPERFAPAIRERDEEQLHAIITKPEVEEAVLERVHDKASTYTRELATAPYGHCVPAETIVEIYRRWVIPMNKRVQVLYLLERTA